MIEKFRIYQDSSAIREIITRFENNRTGNVWNKIDFSIDSNPQADEFGTRLGDVEAATRTSRDKIYGKILSDSNRDEEKY